MKLVVGIGNIGKNYENTRHNIGFMVIDSYLGKVNFQEKFNAYYYKTIIDGENVIFIKPKTFVNNSGLAVVEFMKYYDISIDNLLVIQDDLDQISGNYKLKFRSSSGGHNGIKSIISALGSEDFLRLKIGIKTEYLDNVIDFVLGKLSKKEMDNFQKNEDTYKKIIDSFIKNGNAKTMNIYNTK